MEKDVVVKQVKAQISFINQEFLNHQNFKSISDLFPLPDFQTGFVSFSYIGVHDRQGPPEIYDSWKRSMLILFLLKNILLRNFG